MNFSLMKSWQNWALVAFSIVIILFILHTFFRDTNNVPAFAPE